MNKPVYFAHPVNSYDTSLESAVEQLAVLVIGCDIESPNKPHHQEAYKRWKERTKKSRDVHNAMSYFFKVVQPGCDGCVALPFLDGKMGLGVAGEVMKADESGQLTWYVEPTNADATEADIAAFISDPTGNPLFVVREFTDDEKKQIRSEVEEHQARINGDNQLDGKLVVSHPETRLRTFYVYGREKRPYEEAHLVSMPIPDGFYPEDK